MIEWAREQLATRGIAVTGATELIHDRPWSQVVRIPTGHGPKLCKTMFPPLAFEVPVTAALARWAPGLVTPVIAVDPARRFMLMDDAGERLREILERDRDIAHWTGIMLRYAQLQLGVAPRADELVAMGAPDRRAAVLVREFEAVIATDELLTIAGSHSSSPEELAALRALVPRIRAWADELAGTVPDSIQHDDLHDGQIFIKDGVVRFLDWGDSNVSHPFYTLVVLERSVANRFECEEDDPRIRRLRDEYLEPFTLVATRARIDACLPVALRLGHLCRALTWLRVVRGLRPEDRQIEVVPGWFRQLIEVSTR
ncbi:MAG TPA: hypothetical protein VM052_07435 [Candidatus Limnocylindrales bacterium]|nr:hypothetical protein [Candidatus Limnocylindrales bacterium]